jgi:cysteine-rich repeat protein
MRPRTSILGLIALSSFACGAPPSEGLCGDALLDGDEACDDGNTASGDGCRSDCQGVEVCGDGLLDANESCDDGNIDDGDGCRGDCQGEEVCGDGLLDVGEECDDGNQVDGDGCESSCVEVLLERTFIMNQLDLPDDDQEIALFGQDFNGDGQIDFEDNAARAVQTILSTISQGGFALELNLNDDISSGQLLLTKDLASAGFVDTDNVSLLGFLGELVVGGAPGFDGSDVVTAPPGSPTFPFQAPFITSQVVTTARSSFFFPFAFGPTTTIFLPMGNTVLTGTLDPTASAIQNGALSGTINSLDFAASMPVLASAINELIQGEAREYNNGGQPIACSNDVTCTDVGVGGGVCTERDGLNANTGVCVAAGGPASQILPFTDQDEDGNSEVQFNEVTGIFIQNELNLVFEFNENRFPGGLLGNLFDLDLDGDGVNDAMGIGVGFSSVSAIRAP